jgi:hypothetical protein
MSASMIEPPLFHGVIDSGDSFQACFISGENGFSGNLACESSSVGEPVLPGLPGHDSPAGQTRISGTLLDSRRDIHPLRHEISVDRMSYKDTNAKQTQNHCDHFHHFDAPCFTIVTSDSRSWFQAGFVGSKMVSSLGRPGLFSARRSQPMNATRRTN